MTSLRVRWLDGGDTASTRSRLRERRIAASSATALVAKLLSVGVALLTVPLTLRFLGAERYGMWLILSSLIAILSFADLGIGNGLLNSVAAAHGRDDRAGMRMAVSSGAAALCGVALLIVAVFALAYPFVRWFELFNVRSPLARAEAGPAVAVFVGCFALAIPTGIVQRVQMGVQRGFLANLWQCAGSLCTLAGVIVAITLQASLPWLVGALMGGNLIVAFFNSIVFFGGAGRDIHPALSSVHAAECRRLLSAGFWFLLIQFAASVIAGAAPIIIAHSLGADWVASYSVPERLFALVTMLSSLALQPLWPAYREAAIRGDLAWMRRTLGRSTAAAALIALSACGILLVLAQPIIALWVGQSIKPTWTLLLGLAFWRVAECVLWSLAMFLQAVGTIRDQAILLAIAATIFVPVAVLLTPRLGVAAPPLIAGVALCFIVLLPYAVLTRHAFRQLEDGRAPSAA